MLNPQELLGLIQTQVSQVLPEVGKGAQDELTGNLKLLITGVISKLDFVSRDEFEAQQLVLERTREKLEKLEKEFAEMESNISSNAKS